MWCGQQLRNGGGVAIHDQGVEISSRFDRKQVLDQAGLAGEKRHDIRPRLARMVLGRQPLCVFLLVS